MIRIFGYMTASIIALGSMISMMNLLPTCHAVTISIQPQQATTMNNIPRKESPFACITSVYTPAQKARKGELDDQFRTLAIAYRELPDGYAIQFPSDETSYETIAEWFAMERLCCPFFSMDLELRREDGSVWLNLSGREGVKRFIEAEFQSMKRLKKAASIDANKASAKESPFACKISAYTADQKARKEIVGKQFRTLVAGFRELPNGYAFQYPAEIEAIKGLAEWIALERLCCPFFTFDLAAEREGGTLWLNLTGRDGVKKFIASEFQAAFGRR